MSATLLAITAALYIGVSFNEASKGDGGLSLMFASYAVANIGLIWRTW